MEYAFTDEGDGAAVMLSGRFTYDDSRKFHEFIGGWDFGARPFVVLDCRYLSFLDSTAVGMLFLLVKRCEQAGGTVTVRGATAAVAQSMRRVSLNRYVTLQDG